MSKKRYGFKSDPDIPRWYGEIFYKLGFRRINGMGRNYYINLTDGIVCRVTKDRKLKEMKDGATVERYGKVKLKTADGTYKDFSTHRLVAEFIKNALHKPFVNHKKIDRNCNSIYDLEWVTPSENIRHYLNFKKSKESVIETEEMNEHNSN